MKVYTKCVKRMLMSMHEYRSNASQQRQTLELLSGRVWDQQDVGHYCRTPKLKWIQIDQAGPERSNRRRSRDQLLVILL